MTLDIKGGLKNTGISSNRYSVIDELLSNAIDSYLIRWNTEKNVPPFSMTLSVEFFLSSLVDDQDYDLKISCRDNGSGFGDEQVKAFITKDSTYKDRLSIQGIGKCKGAGRIQFFHYFNLLKIDSIFTTGDTAKLRTLEVFENTLEISEEHFKTTTTTGKKTETTVILQGIKKNVYQKHLHSLNLRNEFSAKAIRSYLFVAFLQRFIILKRIVGNFSISITEIEGLHTATEFIKSKDLPEPTGFKTVNLACGHRTNDNTPKQHLRVTRYSLPTSNFKDSEHEIALCANSALVSSITKHFLRKPADRRKPIDGNFELLLVEGEFLEEKVNEQRDGFRIPKDCSATPELENTLSVEDIVNSLEDYVFSILTPGDFDKEALINSTQEKFGISRSMLNEANIKVHHFDTEENIAKRVLRKYQDEIIDETADIYNLKEQLLSLDPRSQDFREKVNELSWKYTSSIKKVDMANLSQLVVRRSFMLQVLKAAVELMLSCQNDSEAKNDNERIIHNVFFPTGKDSTDLIDHDIWVLSEEYHYFEHIASEKSLASIPWNESSKLFDADIDSSLEALFAKNNRAHRLKRPDIAIFNEEGAAIVIEFKAPGVELQEHIPDLVQYARLLAAKSHGRIKKVYGYLIGDCLDETRMPPSYTRFPSGLGYFNTDPIKDPATNLQYGELYSEVLFYGQFIDRATSRLKVYRNKLGMDLRT